MSGTPHSVSLAAGFELCGMTCAELWLAQCALAGSAGEIEVEAYVSGALVARGLQHDLIAYAINEALGELGEPISVAYSRHATPDVAERQRGRNQGRRS